MPARGPDPRPVKRVVAGVFRLRTRGPFRSADHVGHAVAEATGSRTPAEPAVVRGLNVGHARSGCVSPPGWTTASAFD